MDWQDRVGHRALVVSLEFDCRGHVLDRNHISSCHVRHWLGHATAPAMNPASPSPSTHCPRTLILRHHLKGSADAVDLIIVLAVRKGSRFVKEV